MQLANIATLEFTDRDSGDDACFIVDVGPGAVGLCLSLSQNGDTHAVLAVADAHRVLGALQIAVTRAEQMVEEDG